MQSRASRSKNCNARLLAKHVMSKKLQYSQNSVFNLVHKKVPKLQFNKGSSLEIGKKVLTASNTQVKKRHYMFS